MASRPYGAFVEDLLVEDLFVEDLFVEDLLERHANAGACVLHEQQRL